MSCDLFSQNSDDEISNIPPYLDPLNLKEKINLKLKQIYDPEYNEDILSLNLIEDFDFDFKDFTVRLKVNSNNPELIKTVKDSLLELDHVENVEIEQTSLKPITTLPYSTLKGVKNIIAIASCKGGVGKTTIAVNLAYMLNKLGAHVGLVDADVYGPSLQTLLPLEDHYIYGVKPNTHIDISFEDAPTEKKVNEVIALNPVIYDGVKMVSSSFMKTSKNYTAMRGPIASNLVEQLIGTTYWGVLDFLIIDLPPGTGDIHITLAQTFRIDGSIMVTTPHPLSIVDVEKGISMFNDLKIPLLGIVENMNEYVCTHCHKKTPIFKSSKTLEAPFKISLPLDLDFGTISECPDQFPYVKTCDTSSTIYKCFEGLAEYLMTSMMAYATNKDSGTQLIKGPDGQSLSLKLKNGEIYTKNSAYIRLHCRCADCATYNQLKRNIRNLPTQLSIKKIRYQGSYAVIMNWSDNHESLYSYNVLVGLLKESRGKIKKSKNDRR